eukprot:s5473_g4.t1
MTRVLDPSHVRQLSLTLCCRGILSKLGHLYFPRPDAANATAKCGPRPTCAGQAPEGGCADLCSARFSGPGYHAAGPVVTGHSAEGRWRLRCDTCSGLEMLTSFPAASMPGDHKTAQETAEYVVPTSTTDLEEVLSPAGGSSGNGEVEPLSPESEGGTYPPGLPHPLGSMEHDSSSKFKHGAGTAKPKSGPYADTASKSPRYVNLDFVATPFVETLDVALPQKLPLPLFQGPAKPETPHPFDRSLHDRGECKPCAWFWTPGGCQKGDSA